VLLVKNNLYFSKCSNYSSIHCPRGILNVVSCEGLASMCDVND